MALQTANELAKFLLLVGGIGAGTFLVKNGKASGLIGDLQTLVKGLEKAAESNTDSEEIAAVVRWLAQEVRQLASTGLITMLTDRSDLLTLIVPVATLGSLGYRYMWLKKVKSHLTQKIENLDGKIDEQREMSKKIMNEVRDTRGDIDKVAGDLYSLRNTVFSLVRDTRGDIDKVAGELYSLRNTVFSLGLKDIVETATEIRPIKDTSFELNNQLTTNLLRSTSAKSSNVR